MEIIMYKINNDKTYGGIETSHCDKHIDVTKYTPPRGYTYLKPADESYIWNDTAWIEKPVIEEPNIETLKRMKYLEIKNEADRIINEAVKSDYAQGEIDTFQQQYEGARDIVNGISDSKNAIFVVALANTRSRISGITVTPIDLSNKIIANYEAARELTVSVLGKRQGLSDLLYSSTIQTKEQINNIQW